MTNLRNLTQLDGRKSTVQGCYTLKFSKSHILLVTEIPSRSDVFNVFSNIFFLIVFQLFKPHILSSSILPLL